MGSDTKTLRPLKKGDPCYVRIQRRGKPVLAEYSFQCTTPMWHVVIVGSQYVFCMPANQVKTYDEAIFVAKPVVDKTTTEKRL